MKKYYIIFLLLIFIGCPKKIIYNCIKIKKGIKGVKFTIESREKFKIGIVRIKLFKKSYQYILKNIEAKNKHSFEISKTRFGSDITYQADTLYNYEIDTSLGRYLGSFIILDISQPDKKYLIDFNKKNDNLKVFHHKEGNYEK